MKDFTYVYIVVSEADAAIHYTGITQDLAVRLVRHNREAASMRRRIDLGLLRPRFAFKSDAKARVFEKYLKPGSGREFACRHF